MSKIINLTQGYTTIVDDDLFDILNQFKWRVQISKKCNTQYGIRDVLISEKHIFKTKKILLHRYIFYIKNLSLETNEIIDHKDSNGLNNRSKNLRKATLSQNGANRKTNKNNKLGLKNISINTSGNRKKIYYVEIKSKNKRYFSKYFANLKEAISVRNKKLKEINGEFANNGH